MSARLTFNYYDAVEPHEHCTDKLYQTVASSVFNNLFFKVTGM